MATAIEAYQALRAAVDTGEADTLPLILFAVQPGGGVRLITNIPVHLLPVMEKIVLDSLAHAKARYAN